jgi:hypothetical protein
LGGALIAIQDCGGAGPLLNEIDAWFGATLTRISGRSELAGATLCLIR